MQASKHIPIICRAEASIKPNPEKEKPKKSQSETFKIIAQKKKPKAAYNNKRNWPPCSVVSVRQCQSVVSSLLAQQVNILVGSCKVPVGSCKVLVVVTDQHNYTKSLLYHCFFLHSWLHLSLFLFVCLSLLNSVFLFLSLSVSLCFLYSY